MATISSSSHEQQRAECLSLAAQRDRGTLRDVDLSPHQTPSPSHQRWNQGGKRSTLYRPRGRPPAATMGTNLPFRGCASDGRYPDNIEHRIGAPGLHPGSERSWPDADGRLSGSGHLHLFLHRVGPGKGSFCCMVQIFSDRVKTQRLTVTSQDGPSAAILLQSYVAGLRQWVQQIHVAITACSFHTGASRDWQEGEGESPLR
jgi:hypothetical protein